MEIVLIVDCFHQNGLFCISKKMLNLNIDVPALGVLPEFPINNS